MIVVITKLLLWCVWTDVWERRPSFRRLLMVEKGWSPLTGDRKGIQPQNLCKNYPFMYFSLHSSSSPPSLLSERTWWDGAEEDVWRVKREPANPGSPGRMAIKAAYNCVCCDNFQFRTAESIVFSDERAVTSWLFFIVRCQSLANWSSWHSLWTEWTKLAGCNTFTTSIIDIAISAAATTSAAVATTAT